MEVETITFNQFVEKMMGILAEDEVSINEIRIALQSNGDITEEVPREADMRKIIEEAIELAKNDENENDVYISHLDTEFSWGIHVAEDGKVVFYSDLDRKEYRIIDEEISS